MGMLHLVTHFIDLPADMYQTVLVNWCLITHVCIRRYLFDTVISVHGRGKGTFCSLCTL